MNYFTLQSMNVVYWVCVLAVAGFVGWTHDHTDEIPVVLGFVLILSTVLGVMFPRRALITGLLTGAPVFIVETLVHYSLIRAPYPPSVGLPWPALLGLVPALGGAFFGAAVRGLNSSPDPRGIKHRN
jgi:hypothetical protein